jgi:hypothetical protein
MRYSPIFITGLLVIIPPTIFAQEADVGDKPANAERMSSGGRERNTLLSPTDIDFYEMTIRDNSGHLTVNFSQEAPPGANPNSGWRLDIYAEEDLANSLYTVVLPETSLEVELEQGLGPGTYYYKVSSISDQVFPDAEYTINNSWEDSDNYEIQPNNSPDTATPIRANEAFWGNLSSMQDIDFFRFIPQAPDLVTITLTQDNPAADPKTGWVLSLLNPAQEVQMPSTALNATLQIQMEANVPYYIRVGSFSPPQIDSSEESENGENSGNSEGTENTQTIKQFTQLMAPVGRPYKLTINAPSAPVPPTECPFEFLYAQNPVTFHWITVPTVCDVPAGWLTQSEAPENSEVCPSPHAKYYLPSTDENGVTEPGRLIIPLMDLKDEIGNEFVFRIEMQQIMEKLEEDKYQFELNEAKFIRQETIVEPEPEE